MWLSVGGTSRLPEKTIEIREGAIVRHMSRAQALLMRTALRFGDPAAAVSMAEQLPSTAPARSEAGFLWMLGSSRFLSRDYAASEQPLLALFRSSRATRGQKAAAAYALCGFYGKLRNIQEQLRFARWLNTPLVENKDYFSGLVTVADMSLYGAPGGISHHYDRGV